MRARLSASDRSRSQSNPMTSHRLCNWSSHSRLESEALWFRTWHEALRPRPPPAAIDDHVICKGVERGLLVVSSRIEWPLSTSVFILPFVADGKPLSFDRIISHFLSRMVWSPCASGHISAPSRAKTELFPCVKKWIYIYKPIFDDATKSNSGMSRTCYDQFFLIIGLSNDLNSPRYKMTEVSLYDSDELEWLPKLETSSRCDDENELHQHSILAEITLT
jgi:hypothetical protein